MYLVCFLLFVFRFCFLFSCFLVFLFSCFLLSPMLLRFRSRRNHTGVHFGCKTERRKGFLKIGSQRGNGDKHQNFAIAGQQFLEEHGEFGALEGDLGILVREGGEEIQETLRRGGLPSAAVSPVLPLLAGKVHHRQSSFPVFFCVAVSPFDSKLNYPMYLFIILWGWFQFSGHVPH